MQARLRHWLARSHGLLLRRGGVGDDGFRGGSWGLGGVFNGLAVSGAGVFARGVVVRVF